MSHLRTLLLLFLFFPLYANAQLHLGVRGGYNISSISFIPDYKEQSVYDRLLDVGLVVKQYNLNYLGFQGELNFTQRGFRRPMGEEHYYKRISSYLEAPLFMQIRVKGKRLFAHINVGATASYMLYSHHGNNTQGAYDMGQYKINILVDNRFDYGLMGGLAVGYEFNFGTLQIEARYQYGFGDLYYYKFEGNPSRSPVRVQNVSFTYLYNLSSWLQNKKLKLVENENSSANVINK